MVDTILLIKASERGGRATREFIVLQTITFFNLHRCLQFCFKPRQCDSMIDAKAFSFVNVANKKAVRAAKTAQLFTANGSHEAAIGDAYMYEADGKQFRVEVVDKHNADGRKYVPRCVAGSDGADAAPADLDATNGKLLVRRFSKRGAGQIKDPPAVLFHVSTTDFEIHQGQLRHMRASMRWEEEWYAEMRSPAGQEEMRQHLQESLMTSVLSEAVRAEEQALVATASQQQQQQQRGDADAGAAAAAAEEPCAAQPACVVPTIAAAAADAKVAVASPTAAAAVAVQVAVPSAPAAAPLAAPVAALAPGPVASTAAAAAAISGQPPPPAAAAAAATSRPQGQGAAAVKPAAAAKASKGAAGNNSILKYFSKQPVPAR